MERRDLLIGLTSLLIAPSTVLAVQPDTSTERFRWTSDGRVFRRRAGGWVESINLGEETRIVAIYDSGLQTTLTATHAGRRFRLRSVDGRRWRVA